MNIVKSYNNKLEYYKVATRCLSVFLDEDKRLTSTEEDIVAFILSNPGPVEGRLRKELLKYLKMSTQSLSGHMKRIREKGWIDYNNRPDTKLEKIIQGISVSIKYGDQ